MDEFQSSCHGASDVVKFDSKLAMVPNYTAW